MPPTRNCTLVLLDDSELADDLMYEVTDVLTSLCARLYEPRSAARRASLVLEAAWAQGEGDAG